jgi:hypothetical protein
LQKKQYITQYALPLLVRPERGTYSWLISCAS